MKVKTEKLDRAIQEIDQLELMPIKFVDPIVCGGLVGMKLLIANLLTDGVYDEFELRMRVVNRAWRALWVACAISSQEARDQLAADSPVDREPQINALLNIRADLVSNFFAGELVPSFVAMLYDDQFYQRLNADAAIKSEVDFMVLAGVALIYLASDDLNHSRYERALDHVALGIELFTFAENQSFIRTLRDRDIGLKSDRGRRMREQRKANEQDGLEQRDKEVLRLLAEYETSPALYGRTKEDRRRRVIDVMGPAKLLNEKPTTTLIRSIERRAAREKNS